MVTQRESRVAGGYPVVENKHGPMFVRCTLCAKVLCTTCATPVMALKGTLFDTDGVTEAQAAASKAAATEAEHFGPQTLTKVWQHPQRPLPFYVLDGQKLADTEKLAWIHQELEDDAGIETFCTTFLDIFADKFTTAVAQKKTALRLWCVHNGREVITASINLPADELEYFELAWNAEALARCRGCTGEVAGVRAGFHVSDPYCSERCRVGGMQIVCRTCKAPATLAGDWRHCGACGRLPPKRKKPEDESNLDKMLNQNIESLTIANNVFQYDLVPKEGGEATRRKRA